MPRGNKRDGAKSGVAQFLLRKLSFLRPRTNGSSSDESPEYLNKVSQAQNVRDYIEELDGDEFLRQLEGMMDDMGIMEFNARQAVLGRTSEEKKLMLQQYFLQLREGDDSAHAYGASLVEAASTDVIAADVAKTVSALRVDLTNRPLDWVKGFIMTQGLDCLLTLLPKCQHKVGDPEWDGIHLDVIRCLKAAMGNDDGLKKMMATHDSVTIVAGSLDTKVPRVMLEAVKLISAVCSANTEGYGLVIAALEAFAKDHGGSRFAPLVKGVGKYDDMPLIIACLTFANAIISGGEHPEGRKMLREEFQKAGLDDKFQENKKMREFSQITAQLRIFDGQRREDLIFVGSPIGTVSTTSGEQSMQKLSEWPATEENFEIMMDLIDQLKSQVTGWIQQAPGTGDSASN